MEKVLRIEGMTCNHCAHTVHQALSKLPGMNDVHVSLDGGSAEIDFDPEQVSLEAMQKAVEDAGYTLIGTED
ncbi:MAG: heavy-metal-associated domain-containing protein [Candidatus Carbobacillus altaicus]|nr:heavy-metal-associated domain-containing protein [Candidatus Carbobacillus altaicus]